MIYDLLSNEIPKLSSNLIRDERYRYIIRVLMEKNSKAQGVLIKKLVKYNVKPGPPRHVINK